MPREPDHRPGGSSPSKFGDLIVKRARPLAVELAEVSVRPPLFEASCVLFPRVASSASICRIVTLPRRLRFYLPIHPPSTTRMNPWT